METQARPMAVNGSARKKRLIFRLLTCAIICIPATWSPSGRHSAAHTVGGQSFSIKLSEYASGFQQPVDIAASGSPSDGRLFIVERQGLIRILGSNQSVLPSPFLDLRRKVNSSGSEQGLLGLIFDPDYAQSGYFFVNYTGSAGETTISRFRVSAGDPDRADPASEFVILRVPQPRSNHNAGDLAFGPDGYLYIPLGDGGGSDDPKNNAQNTHTLLGSLLRLDVRDPIGTVLNPANQVFLPVIQGPGVPYRIPPENPFEQDGDPQTRGEIWAMGLRNPWRISFDRATGDLWIGDVGQDAWEEIDYQPASSIGGENYGWRCYEGDQPGLWFNPQQCQAAYTLPVFVYGHNLGSSVTGGFVYRGSQWPAMVGHYLLADFGSGRFWSVSQGSGGSWISVNHGIASPKISPSTFGEDAAGELFVADYSTGKIYHLQAGS